MMPHDVSTTLPPPSTRIERISYDEFLRQADEDVAAEWMDGEIVIMSPASSEHQDIVRFLVAVLSAHIEAKRLGALRPAPFQMKLGSTGREPDLLFIANGHMDRLKPTHLEGPADLAIEVVSPESAARDRGEKYFEYEQAGIPEYWLIDPGRKQAEFYQLDDAGHYQTSLADAAGVYRSRALPGFWLSTAWLWERPPVLTALREIGLI